ncbi:MAG: hypothetical protein QXH30_02605 [Candidatus Bilamarchaeaceae archaeon]
MAIGTKNGGQGPGKAEMGREGNGAAGTLLAAVARRYEKMRGLEQVDTLWRDLSYRMENASSGDARKRDSISTERKIVGHAV